MFVVETILPFQFAWVSVFSSSSVSSSLVLSLKHAYINFSKLSIACCVSRYAQLKDMYRGYSSGVELPGREFDCSCLVVRLRRSGAKHLLPLNAIMARTGTAVPLP